MILINDNYWENTNNLHDISRIIRDYYNCELADELDELITNIECNLEECELKNKSSIVEYLINALKMYI